MAGKELEYRLVIKDDGTPTLKKVGTEVDKLGQKGKESGEKAAEGQNKLKDRAAASTKELTSLERTLERLQRTALAFLGMWALTKILGIPREAISTAIEYNSTLEQSRLGIASILMAQGKFIDSAGNTASAVDSMNSSLQMSSEITKQLQLDNLKTIATYDQLVKVYQQTLAPGLAVGFNPQQVREYTVAMVQAASTLGVNLDMMAEETRSMLRGTITPKNTLIATALGLRNEDITKYKGDAEGLFKFIMGRLSAFAQAGELAQKTWLGVLSNTRDAIKITLGTGFEPFFDFLKKEMVDLQNYLVQWTPEGPKVNPEVISTLKTISKLMIDWIENIKLVGSYLARLGPILTMVYRGMELVHTISSKLFMPWDFLAFVLDKVLKIIDPIASKIGNAFKSVTDFIDEVSEFSEFSIIPKIDSKGIRGFLESMSPVYSMLFSIADAVDYLSEKIKNMASITPSSGWMAWFKSLSPVFWALGNSIEAAQKKYDDFRDRVKKIKEVNETIEREDMERGKRALGYVPNPITYDIAQQDELLKLRVTTGQLLDQQNYRLEDSIGYLGDELNLNVELNKLLGEQLVKLAEINRERQKSQLEPIDKNLYTLAIAQQMDFIKVTRWKNAADIKLQIAEINKDYGKQLQLLKDINETEIMRLGMKPETELTPDEQKARRALTEARRQQVRVAEQTEIFGYQDEILQAKAAMAGMTGEIQRQVDIEGEIYENTVKRRVANKELRFDVGKQAEEMGRLKVFTDGLIKVEASRLDYASRIADLQGGLADLTGDYKAQSDAILATNSIQKQQLENEGKLKGLEGIRIKELMDETAITKAVQVNLKGAADIDVRRLEAEIQIAEAAGKGLESYVMQGKVLDRNYDLAVALANQVKDEKLRNALLELAKLTKEAGEAGIITKQREDLWAYKDRYSQLAQSISEMTGEVYKYEAAVALSVQIEKERIWYDPKMSQYYDILSRLIDKQAELNKLDREFGKLQTTAQLSKDLAELSGSWQNVKDAELGLLKIEYERKLAVGGLTEAQKELARAVYDQQKAQLQAYKDLNMGALMHIGMIRYVKEVYQDLGDYLANMLPQVLDNLAESFAEFAVKSIGNISSITQNWKDFQKAVNNFVQKMLIDLTALIIKMEMMRALGYGEGTPTSFTGGGTGGGKGWFYNLATTLGQYAVQYYTGGGYGGALSVGGSGYSAGASQAAFQSAANTVTFQEGGIIGKSLEQSTQPKMGWIGQMLASSGNQGSKETGGWISKTLASSNNQESVKLIKEMSTIPPPKGRDTVLVRAEPGEGVIRRMAVNYYGEDFIKKLNQMSVPKEGVYYQEGGIVNRPTMAVVGERPEAFIPLKGGRVPVEVMEKSPSNNIQLHMTIVTPDANSFKSSQKQIMAQAFLEAARAAKRSS